MSWDVSIVSEKPIEIESHQEGGVICMGGSSEPSMSVTYNYSPLYHLAGLDFRSLNGLGVEQAIKTLDYAIEKLVGPVYEKDYWAPTPGNACKALEVIREWCRCAFAQGLTDAYVVVR